MLKINLLLASLLMAPFFSDVAEAASIKISLNNDSRRFKLAQWDSHGRQQGAFHRDLQNRYHYETQLREGRRNAEFYRQQAQQQAAIKRQKQIQQWRDSIPELESKGDYIALAVIFKNLRENKKLSDAAEKAVKANPNSALAYNLRAIAREGSNDLQGALADYNRAVEISPNQYLYYTNRGDLKKGFDKNGAIQDFLTALKLVKVDKYAFHSETGRVIRELQSLGVTNPEWD